MKRIKMKERTLNCKKMAPEDILASTKELRAKTKEPKLTEALLHQAKNEGRP
jgi:hypothetical protein